MRDVAICVAGDSIVAGVGDPKALGWVGRVAARTTGISLIVYNLGVRGDSIAAVGHRLARELPPRFAPGDEHRLVVSAGLRDAVDGTALDESTSALTSILNTVGVPCLVVGPPPVGASDLRSRLERLDHGLAGVCAGLSVPYVQTFEPLSRNPDWVRDLNRSSDGVHPGQTGYGLLAWLVLHGGWYAWLDLPEPTQPPVRRRQP